MKAYRILEWDSQFFGFTVAYIDLPAEDIQNLERVVSELRRSNVTLAYWSVSNSEAQSDSNLVRQMGGRLVDTKTTFLIDFEGVSLPVKTGVCGGRVEQFHSSMSKVDLRELAIQSGEFSRYAVDPGISREKIEEMYTIWIDRSVAKEIADEVLVIRNEQQRIVGMVTLGRKGERGDIGLIAVDSEFRGKQFGKKLVLHAQEWFIENGYRYGQVVTQGANTAACRLYAKCGYHIEKAESYYHFWL